MKYSRMKMRFQNYVYNSESVEESEDNKITNVVRIESSFGNRSLIFSSLRRYFSEIYFLDQLKS